MSRALKVLEQLSEIGYYGQHDDYGNKPSGQDAEEYMKPFADLKLPDNSGGDGKNHPPKQKKNKSEKPGNKVK